MPNNSKAIRDKSEKKKNKNRVPTPPEKQVPAEGVESFLSRSSADSGIQEDDDNFTRELPAGEQERRHWTTLSLLLQGD
jgi:hypothetical protein